MATRSQATKKLISRIQISEDRAISRRVAKIKRAIAGASFYTHELTQIEAIVFGAYGRTKLQ